MKRIAKWSGLFSIIALLGSCTSTVHVEKDKRADFSNYKTFAWVDKNGDEEGKRDRNRTNDLTEQKMKDAVTNELEKTAGWRESKNHPDVLINYDVLVERATKENNNPVYSNPYSRIVYNPYTRRYATIYYPSEFMGYDRSQESIREGTVTITMIDARTDKTVWQGWTTDEVNSRNLTSREIQTYVHSIFKKFDIAKN
jgi:hypothetical protein